MADTTRHTLAQARYIWPPEPGIFALRLTKGGWRVPAEILHEAGFWYAIINGKIYAPHKDPALAEQVARCWHYGLRIDQTTYDWMIATRDAAATIDPNHPSLHPTKAINHNRLKPLAIPPTATAIA